MHTCPPQASQAGTDRPAAAPPLVRRGQTRATDADRPPLAGRQARRVVASAVVLLVVAASVVLTPAVAYASTADATPAAAPATGPTESTLSAASAVMVLAVNDLPTIVSNLRTWVMGILAGLATLFLTIGGVRYLMAGGDPSEVEKAKAAFKSAAMGYCLAVIAPVVLTVLQSIIGS
jgi:Type IV secretion system pilin